MYNVNNYDAETETIEVCKEKIIECQWMLTNQFVTFYVQTADGDNDDIPASQHWILPNREFQGQWEYLYYEDDLKENVNTKLNSSYIEDEDNFPLIYISASAIF